MRSTLPPNKQNMSAVVPEVDQIVDQSESVFDMELMEIDKLQGKFVCDSAIPGPLLSCSPFRLQQPSNILLEVGINQADIIKMKSQGLTTVKGFLVALFNAHSPFSI